MLFYSHNVVDGQVRIQLLNYAAESCDCRTRFSNHADNECSIIAGVTNVTLQQRTVNEWSRVFIQAEILTVFRDGDDFDQWPMAPAGTESLAYWIVARPKATCEGLVDDRYRRSIFFVLRCKITTGD